MIVLPRPGWSPSSQVPRAAITATAGSWYGRASIAACIVGVYQTLSFPEPEGGKVMVTYPIDFQRD